MNVVGIDCYGDSVVIVGMKNILEYIVLLFDLNCVLFCKGWWWFYVN